MNRRDFITTLAAAVPMIASASALRYTVVKPIRLGDRVVGWSEIHPPSGRAWTLSEIRSNGYRIISRTPSTMAKGKVN